MNETMQLVTEPTAVLASVVLAEPVAAAAPSIETQFNSLLQDLSLFKTQLSDIQTKVRLLEKTITKELKNKDKQEKKQSTIALKIQQPSGFDKPAPVTEELCMFLRKPVGTLLARTEVTTAVTNYIRTHKLQDMTQRKKIKPDEALSTLLHLGENAEQLTYFNLQKHLSIHFI